MKNPTTISSGESDERAAFEAWFETVHLEYDASVPAHAWGAWQARAALATQPAPAASQAASHSAPAEPSAAPHEEVTAAIHRACVALAKNYPDDQAGFIRMARDCAIDAVLATPLGAESKACASVGAGDPAEPKDDSDREYTRPIGYLPAYELGRLHSGHDANLRSAKFGPSPLDGDVPVYLCDAPALRALVAKWRHAAEHLGLEGLASLADCADELESALASPAPCLTCNGHGMIGGLLPGDGGYDGQDCPDCTPPAAPAATEAPSEPFAYYIHIAAEQRGEFVHNLDEALDDLTNCDCKITELFDHATPAPAVGASDWWRKRADEIELQVARSGSTEAMRCFTDMRTLLQSATNPQPVESKACASVGEPTEPAFAPWFDANEHLLRDRGYTPRDYAMFAWHAALASPAPSVGELVIDPLQGAADWLKTGLVDVTVADIQSRLLIGYNRARRLFDGATPPAAPAATEAPSEDLMLAYMAAYSKAKRIYPAIAETLRALEAEEDAGWSPDAHTALMKLKTLIGMHGATPPAAPAATEGASDAIAWSTGIVWGHKQSEMVVKLTRKAQPEYGFIHPLHAALASSTPTQPPGSATPKESA